MWIVSFFFKIIFVIIMKNDINVIDPPACVPPMKAERMNSIGVALTEFLFITIVYQHRKFV